MIEDSSLNLGSQIVRELQEWIEDKWKGKEDPPIIGLTWTPYFMDIHCDSVGLWSSVIHDDTELSFDFCKREFIMAQMDIINSFKDEPVPAPEFNPEDN